MAQHPGEPDAALAMLFIEEVLKRAVERLRETIPEEQDITLGVKPAPALCAAPATRPALAVNSVAAAQRR